MKKFLVFGVAAGLIASSALYAVSAFANVVAHVVTEAQNSPTSIGTAGDLKICPGCQASIASTGSVPSSTFGTSRSDSSARASADYGVLKTFATAASSGHFGE